MRRKSSDVERRNKKTSVVCLGVLSSLLLFASCDTAVNSRGGRIEDGGGGSSSSSSSGTASGADSSGAASNGFIRRDPAASTTTDIALDGNGAFHFVREHIEFQTADPVAATAPTGSVTIAPLPDTLYTESQSGITVSWSTYNVVVTVDGTDITVPEFTKGDTEVVVIDNIPVGTELSARAVVEVTPANLAYTQLQAFSSPITVQESGNTVTMYVRYPVEFTKDSYPATSIPSATYYVNSGSNAVLGDCAPDLYFNDGTGMAFTGWSLSAGGTAVFARGTAIPVGSYQGRLLLHAVYTPSINLTVTGGTRDAAASTESCDVYSYDYATLGDDGVTYSVSGTGISGTIDGTAFSGSTTGKFARGRHVVRVQLSGCSTVIEKTIDVYAKAEFEEEYTGTGSGTSWKYSYMTYAETGMPVTITPKYPAGSTPSITMKVTVNGTASTHENGAAYSGNLVLGDIPVKIEPVGDWWDAESVVEKTLTVQIKPVSIKLDHLDTYMSRGENDNDNGLVGNWYIGGTWVGGCNGGVISRDKTWTRVPGDKVNTSVSITRSSLSNDIKFEANGMEEWDGSSDNDSLGSGSTTRSLKALLDGRDGSDISSVTVNTSGGKGSTSNCFYVTLSED